MTTNHTGSLTGQAGYQATRMERSVTAPMKPTTPDLVPGYDSQQVREAIRDNAFLHFAQMKSHHDPEYRPLVLVRGDGTTV